MLGVAVKSVLGFLWNQRSVWRGYAHRLPRVLPSTPFARSPVRCRARSIACLASSDASSFAVATAAVCSAPTRAARSMSSLRRTVSRSFSSRALPQVEATPWQGPYAPIPLRHVRRQPYLARHRVQLPPGQVAPPVRLSAWAASSDALRFSTIRLCRSDSTMRSALAWLGPLQETKNKARLAGATGRLRRPGGVQAEHGIYGNAD